MINQQLLDDYGWNKQMGTIKLPSEHYPARVIRQDHDIYTVVSAEGEMMARVSGKMIYDAAGNADYPAVGDWVVIDRLNDAGGDAIIKEILPRRSAFIRKAAGSAQASQVVATNVDIIFICMALNEDFNLRRLERYLTIAWDSGAKPMVILTKSDICNDLAQKLADVYAVSAGCGVVVCSALTNDGMVQIKERIQVGQTVAFIGSSGVGKSTLINALLAQERLETQAVGQRDKGRHTTTYRQLFLLPDGGMVIDTPGMRELQLESGDLNKAFDDIEQLAQRCRFGDCTHSSEPGCAVQDAIATGVLSAERLENFRKLQRELGYEGLNARQMEAEKIKAMFGSKQEMKQLIRGVKEKSKRR